MEPKYEKLYQLIRNHLIDMIANHPKCALIGVLSNGRVGILYPNLIIYSDGFDYINLSPLSVIHTLEKIYMTDKLGVGIHNLKRVLRRECPIWVKPEQVVLSKEEVADKLGLDPDYLTIE